MCSLTIVQIRQHSTQFEWLYLQPVLSSHLSKQHSPLVQYGSLVEGSDSWPLFRLACKNFANTSCNSPKIKYLPFFLFFLATFLNSTEEYVISLYSPENIDFFRNFGDSQQFTWKLYIPFPAPSGPLSDSLRQASSTAVKIKPRS